MDLDKHGETEELKPIIVPTYSEEKEEKVGLIDKVPLLKKLKGAAKKKSAPTKTQKKERVLRQTSHILPFVQIEEECITLKTGVMDIFQITTKDLYSLNDDDMQFLLLSQARFYRSYASSYKTVALNFPSNTEKQKNYWSKKKEKTTDSLRIRFIERKLFELNFLERERTNREFFMFVYADTPQQLEEEKNQSLRGMRQSFPLESLSIDKKQDVLFMLANQNSKL
ncbi:hypothetical protein H7992_05060 [Sporosarcina sp. resist]|nr:hypothetical protein H7992_05060 [Sporosarcina sp. resist]